ncbi:MAG: hypothetical protein WCA91_04725 [Candidatus Acidiferrales bacterium]
MHYRLMMPKNQIAAGILTETLKHLKQAPEMRNDILRLNSARCTPQNYELLALAPRPVVLPTA